MGAACASAALPAPPCTRCYKLAHNMHGTSRPGSLMHTNLVKVAQARQQGADGRLCVRGVQLPHLLVAAREGWGRKAWWCGVTCSDRQMARPGLAAVCTCSRPPGLQHAPAAIHTPQTAHLICASDWKSCARLRPMYVSGPYHTCTSGTCLDVGKHLACQQRPTICDALARVAVKPCHLLLATCPINSNTRPCTPSPPPGTPRPAPVQTRLAPTAPRLRMCR